jgi:hypothetical protein
MFTPRANMQETAAWKGQSGSEITGTPRYVSACWLSRPFESAARHRTKRSELTDAGDALRRVLVVRELVQIVEEGAHYQHSLQGRM